MNFLFAESKRVTVREDNKNKVNDYLLGHLNQLLG